MKRLNRSFLAIVLIFSLAMPAWAAGLDLSSDAPATRAMLCGALWEREGKPVVNDPLPFTDVSESADYAEAVRWAAAEQLAGGAGGGRFLPDEAVTREQMAAILYRYALYRGMDVSVGEETNILSYTDFLQRSDWAVSALQWALGSGVLEEKGETLDAWGTVTQADAAAALKRFDEAKLHTNLLQSWTEDAKPAAALKAYMAAVTDPQSADYIPVEDRRTAR